MVSVLETKTTPVFRPFLCKISDLLNKSRNCSAHWNLQKHYRRTKSEKQVLTHRFFIAYIDFVSRLYRVSFRAFLLPEGFGVPATIVTVADNARQAIESACGWYKRNQPYFVSDEDCKTANVEKFSAVELEYFVCYGIEKPMLWEFPAPKFNVRG